MGSRAATGLLLAVTAAVAAGCGGGSPAPARQPGRVTAAAAANRSGAVLFRTACGACHSLNGTDDPRLQGGDLLAFHAPRGQLTQLTREMPVRPALSRSQLTAVVSFVLATERRGR